MHLLSYKAGERAALRSDDALDEGGDASTLGT